MAGNSEHGHAVPLRILLGTWAALIALTWITVAVTQIELGSLNIVVALAVAVVKSTLVALYFMHLRWEKPFNAIIFVSALLFVFLFITLTLIDTTEYAEDRISGYAPAITGVDPAAAAASDDPLAGLVGIDRGRAIFETTCVVCHGPDAQGIQGLGSPALHRQEDWYIVGQLKNFRSGMRGADERDIRGLQMAPIAQALPDEQALEDVADYISSLRGGAVPTPTVEGDPAKGAKTFKTICAACHGGDAMGQSFLKTPALVGQNDWYIVQQIANFQQGIRGSHPSDITGQQMKGMSSTLNDPVVQRNVVAYINSLSEQH